MKDILKKDRERDFTNRVRKSKRFNKVIINKEKDQTFDQEGIYFTNPYMYFLMINYISERFKSYSINRCESRSK